MPHHPVVLFTTVLISVPPLVIPAPAMAAAPVHAPVAPAAARHPFCRITGSSATVRAKPGKSAAALGTAYKGDTCTAHGWAEGDGAWVKVTMKRSGVTGYVHASLVAWGKEGLVRTGA